MMQYKKSSRVSGKKSRSIHGLEQRNFGYKYKIEKENDLCKNYKVNKFSKGSGVVFVFFLDLCFSRKRREKCLRLPARVLM